MTTIICELLYKDMQKIQFFENHTAARESEVLKTTKFLLVRFTRACQSGSVFNVE
jgi:hypothetical protein